MLRILSVCVIVGVAAGVMRAQEPAAPAAAAPAADDWMPTEVKNLTVLPKDMAPADVMRIMRAWNDALKVDCVFCHVGMV